MKKYSKNDESNLWNSYFRYHGYAYDGIWTIAKAIDAVERENNNESLVDFKYKWVELDLIWPWLNCSYQTNAEEKGKHRNSIFLWFLVCF